MNRPILILSIFLALSAGFSFLGAKDSEPEIILLVNQAGYDTRDPKRVWLQTDFEPGEITTFQLLLEGEVVYQGYWRRVQKIDSWNLWYREGNFSPWMQPGKYKARIKWRNKFTESPPFLISAHQIAKWIGPLATRFFFIQRCGTEVPGWHAPCHLDDARMPDGSHRDLTGGWHDAGDYNKYNGYTPLAVYALSKFAKSDAASHGVWTGGFSEPLEEALWGARWLRKCQDPESKKLIYAVFSGYGYWGVPEKETDNLPGSSDDRPVILPFQWNENEMAVAAYAVLYRKTGNPEWKQAAEELWNVVQQYDFDDIIQGAKRLLAAVELFRSTENTQYQETAESYAEYLIQAQDENGGWPRWPLAVVDYGLPAASLAEFYIAFPESDLGLLVEESLGQYITFWAYRRSTPFDIPKWSENEYFYPYIVDHWYVGQNSMYLSQAWAGFLISLIIPRQRGLAYFWSSGCLDWVLGANPLGICMMYGAGTAHLKKYHHRYDSISNGKNGCVPGAICNGFTRRREDLDFPYLDLEGNSWQTNEPWLPHNAYLLLALTAKEEKILHSHQ